MTAAKSTYSAIYVTFWKYNLLYHMSMFHFDENGFLPHPFPQSLLMSTHITKAELYFGVGEDETDNWRKSNLIPDSNDLQEVNEELESQRKRAASEVSSTSSTETHQSETSLQCQKLDGQMGSTVYKLYKYNYTYSRVLSTTKNGRGTLI